MSITLAIDCMGGDAGIGVTLPAAFRFLEEKNDAHLILVGQEEKILSHLNCLSRGVLNRLEVLNATQTVDMCEAPAQTLRHKKDSSMRRAIDCVKENKAQAVVSAGNTGALMATSYFVLKTLEGIERPAICTTLPTQNGSVLMLDLGANVDCEAKHLFQFAQMGSALIFAMENKESPKIALLNIGEEVLKGNSAVKNAAELLRQSSLNFVGNVEGNGIFKDEVDIIICDGFVGNVALKAAEGVAQMIVQNLKTEFKRNAFSKIAALLAMPVLKRLKQRFDHRQYNGAMLLGLNGVCVKSHGSADVFAYVNALHYAYNAVHNHVLERIKTQMEQSAGSL